MVNLGFVKYTGTLLLCNLDRQIFVIPFLILLALPPAIPRHIPLAIPLNAPLAVPPTVPIVVLGCIPSWPRRAADVGCLNWSCFN